MPIEVTMPALSPTMKEGNLVSWVKKEGDIVESGDVIAEIETDKAVMEVEASDSGKLGKILVPEGSQAVAVGTLVALMLEDGESPNALEGYSASGPAAETHKLGSGPMKSDDASSSSAPAGSVVNSLAEPSSGSVAPLDLRSSPLARRIAKDKGLDISQISGSGPGGRVVKNDVLRLSSPGAVASPIKVSGSVTPPVAPLFAGRKTPESSLLPIDNMRRVIAKRLLESKQTVPHFYLSLDVVIDELLSLRVSLNKSFADAGLGAKISVNDFVIKASALALRDHPNVNSSWTDDGIVLYSNVDVSVAVTTPGGLITPIVKNADSKSLLTISSGMKDLAARARENKLKLDEFQGGGFSISNLGMYGIKSFNAIINPPQSAILSVGSSTKIPCVDRLGEVGVSNVVNLSLSCDHRVVDGVLGAEFLSSMKGYLENPGLVLALN